ncbi:hypothetical protein KFE25_003479 [Diacronema lutheri]|uniref:Uncharacterized protein n=2 Tax=Diacronema lutheri TaxID=2081491 RepID=A0A8J5XFX9_DIALT|nr:hypothetical protein KFE25_003479 [Diacronema lutheri]
MRQNSPHRPGHGSFRASANPSSVSARSSRRSSSPRVRAASAPRIRQSAAFSSASPRFVPPGTRLALLAAADTPGVGGYTPRVTAKGKSSTVAANDAQPGAAPFGSWQPRETPAAAASRKMAPLPGPGAYSPVVRRNGKSNDVSVPDDLNVSRTGSLSRSGSARRSSSPFASRAKRLTEPGDNVFGVPSTRGETPGVAHYDVPDRSDFNVRPQAHPLGDSPVFRSDSYARPGDAHDAAHAAGMSAPSPGPGDYSPRALRDGSVAGSARDGSTVAGLLRGTRDRPSPMFRSSSPARPRVQTTIAPGPGTYDVKYTRFGSRREVAESAYELGYVRADDDGAAASWSYVDGY